MNKNKYIVYLLIFVIFYVIYWQIVPRPDYINLRIVGTLGLLQFLLSIYSSIKNGQRLISPYIVFLCAMYVFQTGQSLLYSFNIITQKDLIGFLGITIEEVFKAELISFSFLACFQIGALLCSNKKNDGIKRYEDTHYQDRRIIIFGWILVIISIYPYYKELINNAILSMTYGYGRLYNGETKIGLDNLSSLIADYFIPALICLFIGYRNLPYARMGIIIVLIINSFLILLTGGRSEGVIILALILVLWNYLIKSFSKKKLILLGIGGYFFLAILSSIATNRSSTSRDIEDIFISQNSGDSNESFDAIAEMGASMFCLIWTDEIVSQNNDYRYGSTYLYSLTTIIPNVGLWKVHPAKEKANMGEWLTNEKDLTFGTGYSVIAEAYINFGYFGFLWMIFFGFIVAKIFGQLSVAIKRNNMAYTALILILFWFSLKLPRNSFINIVRAIFYFALPVYWITRGYIIKRNL